MALKTNPVSTQDDNRTALDEVVRDPRGSSDAYSFTRWTTWGLRPIVLFAAAYTIVGIVHEWAHALTAYALKVPSTLFQLYVHLDPDVRTLNERTLIGVAGPLVCLGLGLVCWFAYRNAKSLRAGLLLLYLVWFGTATFFGNLMSTPFVGDFSSLALLFQLPMSVRYSASLVGLLSLCSLSFFMGTELRKWTPLGVNAVRATVGVIALPAIVGTAMAILIFLPMPAAYAVTRAGESMFWIVGAVGTLISRKQQAESSHSLSWVWADFVILIVAILIVRVMAGGIAFVP